MWGSSGSCVSLACSRWLATKAPDYKYQNANDDRKLQGADATERQSHECIVNYHQLESHMDTREPCSMLEVPGALPPSASRPSAGLPQIEALNAVNISSKGVPKA